jgi:hypothetical protein
MLTSWNTAFAGPENWTARPITCGPVSMRLDGTGFRHLDAARAITARQSDDPLATLENLPTA